MISYSDHETCKYYQEKNIINRINNHKEKLYLLRVYTKKDEFKDYAKEIFELLQQT
jgi:hypothetical protein